MNTNSRAVEQSAGASSRLLDSDLLDSVRLWQSDMLSTIPGITHGVTRRVEGLGRAHGNVGFSAPRDREDAWAMRQFWCSALGLAPESLVTLGQVHGNVVHVVAPHHAGNGARPGSPQIGLGDALVTNEAGPVLMTLHADCQPILFVDPGSRTRGPAVGVAHAGWRGTVSDVVGSTLSTMTSAFGTRPEDVHVCLGPAIGPCCYVVGDDVVNAWREQADSDAAAAIRPGGEGFRFSLSAANSFLLARAGVRAENVEVNAVCTRCDGDHWFSHRGQGLHTGRFGALMSIAGDKVTG
jgi:YfiH family protein